MTSSSVDGSVRVLVVEDLISQADLRLPELIKLLLDPSQLRIEGFLLGGQLNLQNNDLSLDSYCIRIFITSSSSYEEREL